MEVGAKVEDYVSCKDVNDKGHNNDKWDEEYDWVSVVDGSIEVPPSQLNRIQTHDNHDNIHIHNIQDDNHNNDHNDSSKIQALYASLTKTGPVTPMLTPSPTKDWLATPSASDWEASSSYPNPCWPPPPSQQCSSLQPPQYPLPKQCPPMQKSITK